MGSQDPSRPLGSILILGRVQFHCGTRRSLGEGASRRHWRRFPLHFVEETRRDPLPWQRTSTSLLVRRDPSGATNVQRLINVRAMIVPRGIEIAHRVRTSLLECSIA